MSLYQFLQLLYYYNIKNIVLIIHKFYNNDSPVKSNEPADDIFKFQGLFSLGFVGLQYLTQYQGVLCPTKNASLSLILIANKLQKKGNDKCDPLFQYNE